MAVGCSGCCVYPHGRSSLYPMLLGISAYLFLSVAMSSCVYLEIDGYLYAEPPYVWPGSNKLHTSQIGLFSYQEFSEYGSSGTEHVCATYSSDQIDNFLDGPFKAARAFAVLANIFVGAGALALVFASCAYFEIVLLHGCGWLLIIGSVCEALTFLLYASKVTDGPHNGRFWWGSGLAIASSIAALFAGILTIRLPPSERESTLPSSSTDSEANKRPQADSPVVSEQARPMRPGTETTTESILPDGRRKYTTTKWNKDGTKTVEETIE